MKTAIVPRTNITACTDQASSRYALGGVLVNQAEDPNEVWLSATDGRVFAAAKAAGNTREPDLVPAKAFQGGKTRLEANREIYRENGHWVDRKRAMHDPIEGRFPRCNEVIPDCVDQANTANAESEQEAHANRLPLVCLRFNPHLLAKLAQAVTVNDAGVTLFVRPDGNGCADQAIAVLGDAGFGVLMPFHANAKVRDADIERFRRMADEYGRCFALPGSTPIKLVAPPDEAPEAEPVATEEAEVVISVA